MNTSGSHQTASESTSASLVRRVQLRDPAAWNRLVELYGPLVYQWGRRFGLQEADATDVVQSVFTSVASAIDGFQHDRPGATFRGWLWTLTRNRVADLRRRQQKQVEAEGGTQAQQRLSEIPEQLPDNSTDEASQLESNGLLHRGLKLVRDQFEERTWQAFWRSVVENHPTSEIAADMGITANAVRQAKSRVLRRLRLELGELAE